MPTKKTRTTPRTRPPRPRQPSPAAKAPSHERVQFQRCQSSGNEKKHFWLILLANGDTLFREKRPHGFFSPVSDYCTTTKFFTLLLFKIHYFDPASFLRLSCLLFIVSPKFLLSFFFFFSFTCYMHSARGILIPLYFCFWLLFFLAPHSPLFACARIFGRE